MPVFRKHSRGSTSAMFTKRMGGRVSLFNYNPSIAGGKIGVKRFQNAHHMGRILRKDAQRNMTSIQGAEGSGLATPGSHIGGMMGATPPSSTHGSDSDRKRIFSAISNHLAGNGKRMRRA